MRDGTRRYKSQPAAVAMFLTPKSEQPQSETEQSACHRWLAQSADREQVRQDRIHKRKRGGPTVTRDRVMFISAIDFAPMLFFAPSRPIGRGKPVAMEPRHDGQGPGSNRRQSAHRCGAGIKSAA